MSRTILISGASGMIGSASQPTCATGAIGCIALVRRPVRSDDEIRWDPAAGKLPGGAVDGIDVVVNLSGAGVGDKRWSAGRKQEILDSRLATTGLLARAIAASRIHQPSFSPLRPSVSMGRTGATKCLARRRVPAATSWLE